MKWEEKKIESVTRAHAIHLIVETFLRPSFSYSASLLHLWSLEEFVTLFCIFLCNRSLEFHSNLCVKGTKYSKKLHSFTTVDVIISTFLPYISRKFLFFYCQQILCAGPDTKWNFTIGTSGIDFDLKWIQHKIDLNLSCFHPWKFIPFCEIWLSSKWFHKFCFQGKLRRCFIFKWQFSAGLTEPVKRMQIAHDLNEVEWNVQSCSVQKLIVWVQIGSSRKAIILNLISRVEFNSKSKWIYAEAGRQAARQTDRLVRTFTRAGA